MCAPITPETYLGFERGRYANSNMEAGHVVRYKKPSVLDDLPMLDGEWKIENEHVESYGGTLFLPYMAGEVNVVMQGEGKQVVELVRDGKPLGAKQLGEDAMLEGEKTVVHVEAPRMYRLISDRAHHEGLLELRVPKGVRLYAFTFGAACR
ncbi:hypothetical protein HYV72_02295 [Candidatus Uhrbacteria bacterium]|nr:hypothetical protein [Candidatus Uhrbacteria bacterium]